MRKSIGLDIIKLMTLRGLIQTIIETSGEDEIIIQYDYLFRLSDLFSDRIYTISDVNEIILELLSNEGKEKFKKFLLLK